MQAAVANGAKLTFDEKPSLQDVSGKRFNIEKKGKLYYLNSIHVRNLNLEEWHRIFGHCNLNDLRKQPEVVRGMKLNYDARDVDNFECTTCYQGKMTKTRSRSPDARAKKRLELIHCDLAGPMSIPSKEHSRYAIVFVDDYSGISFVYFLRTKNEAMAASRKFLADTSQYGTIKRFRCDNGTEFTNHEFKGFLIDNKIAQEFSAPHSPHQNGTAERMWRTLFEMARCLLIDSGLPKYFWNYAVRAASYVRNRIYNRRLKITPFEAFTLKKPDVSNMYIFGSQCFAYTEEKKKLDCRCTEGIFLGHDPQSPAYLVYSPEKEKVIKVRLIKCSNKNGNISRQYEDKCETYLRREENLPEESFNLPEPEETEETAAVEPPAPVAPVRNEELVNASETGEVSPRYPQRDRKQPKYLKDYVKQAADTNIFDGTSVIDYCYKVLNVPSNFQEAVKSSESIQWREAMNKEMESLTCLLYTSDAADE